MLIKNTLVTFDWLLKASPSFSLHNESFFDLQVNDPEGVVTYLEGSNNWSDTFIAPTATSDGQLTYDTTFTKAGVYTLILGTGGAASFTILDNALAHYIEQTQLVNYTVHLN